MAVMGWASPEHPVGEALGAISAALDGVVDSPTWSLSDGRVEELLEQAHRLEGRLHGVTLRLVADADRRRAAERRGASSTSAWLRRQLQISPQEAKRHTTLAAALCGRLDLTREALAAGDLSRDHAAVVVKVMETLPGGVGSEVRERAERQLVGWCREFDPRDVARLGRRLWEIVDPDGADAHEGSCWSGRSGRLVAGDI